MKYILTYLSVIILTVYFTACSELQTDIESPTPLSVHKEGILVDSSADFHGNLVRADNWDMRSCKQCHGLDYDGGMVNKSCLSCHNLPTGPENCTTCHGSAVSMAPPRDLNRNTSNTARGVGAHQVHISGNLKGRTVSCTECHNIPGSAYGDLNHIDGDLRAEALLEGDRVNTNTNEPSTSEFDSGLPLFIPDPDYNLSDLTCSNTYCHGYFKNGNLTNAPVWTDPASSVCGSCHGDPTRTTAEERALPKTQAEGGTHPNELNCSACHDGVVNANLNFTDPSKHIDGKLNLFGNDIDY